MLEVISSKDTKVVHAFMPPFISRLLPLCVICSLRIQKVDDECKMGAIKLLDVCSGIPGKQYFYGAI